MCNMELKDKVAIVTGGAQGIGREIANTLAGQGASLVLCDVNPASLETARKELADNGSKVLTYQVDVTSLTQVEAMVKNALDNYKKIDILINNAGITKDNLLLRMKEEEWDAVLNVNLKGAFVCTKAVTSVMIKQRYGRIVNIASVIGLMGNAGQANYAASKAGVIGFTKSIAKELASRNVNVNAVAPGYIQTAMTDKLPQQVKEKMLGFIPLGRFGQPRDVANAVLFLVSEDSGYITGQVITVDGGMVM